MNKRFYTEQIEKPILKPILEVISEDVVISTQEVIDVKIEPLNEQKQPVSKLNIIKKKKK